MQQNCKTQPIFGKFRGKLAQGSRKKPEARINPGSKLTFSKKIFQHSLLAPTWTAFSDYTGPDLLC